MECFEASLNQNHNHNVPHENACVTHFLCVQRLISEQMLSEELISILGPQSEDQLEALFVTAARLATAQPGVIDYIKLLSPVRNKPMTTLASGLDIHAHLQSLCNVPS